MDDPIYSVWQLKEQIRLRGKLSVKQQISFQEEKHVCFHEI